VDDQRANRPTSTRGSTRSATESRFAEYVLPEVDVMYRVALSLTHNHADAEDLVQDTMIRAYRAIDRFDGRHPRAWLLTILRNAQINRVRRRRPELMRDPDATLDRLADEETQQNTVEGMTVDLEFDAEVESAFDSLPPLFREVVELVDIRGMTYQEAATSLDVPVGTVMSRLHRARKRIRNQLEESGFTRRGGSE
jgi:RNA polymerase sigma-70 factor (ECF subfamily)